MSGTAPRLAELSARLSRCPDLDTLVGAALDGLAALFGYEHSLLLLLDEDGQRLYTIASHGYAVAGIGSEVRVGEGVGIAVRQEDNALRERINQALKDIRADGTYQKINDKYFAIDVYTMK